MKFGGARYAALALGGLCLLVPASRSQAPQPLPADSVPGSPESVLVQAPATPAQPLPPIEVEAPRAPTPPTGMGDEGPVDAFGQRGIPWSSGAITSDTTRVGPYGQPQWTVQRPFPNVRTYVLPPGQMQVEQWYRPRWKRDGSREDRILEELAIGLPGRFQLDVYERWNIKQDDVGKYNANHEGVQIELRWAFADWDVIPLNPTLYAEWVQRGNKDDEPDKYELKLLLAESFFDDYLFWAGNFIIEQEVGGDKETELGYNQAFAMTLIERKLLGGLEMIYRAQNVHSDRANWNNEFLIGPTMQWRPTNRTFLDVSALFGTTPGAPVAECYFIFGFQFGTRAGPGFGGINPATLGN